MSSDRGQVLEDVSRKEWLFDLFRCRQGILRDVTGL